MDPASRCTTEQPSAPTRHFDRVLVIVFENQPRWLAERYFRRVAKEGAVLEPFQGLFHPSFPNYLSMVGGKAFPVDPRDADGLRKTPEEIQFVGPTIADRLEAAGHTWKNYAERYSGEPLKSDDDSPHKFARRHVPFLSYVEWKPEYAAHLVAVDPESDSPEGNAFVRDVRSGLPTYSFYSPDLDNDGHDPAVWPPAGLRKAARWLDSSSTDGCHLVPRGKGS